MAQRDPEEIKREYFEKGEWKNLSRAIQSNDPPSNFLWEVRMGVAQGNIAKANSSPPPRPTTTGLNANEIGLYLNRAFGNFAAEEGRCINAVAQSALHSAMQLGDCEMPWATRLMTEVNLMHALMHELTIKDPNPVALIALEKRTRNLLEGNQPNVQPVRTVPIAQTSSPPPGRCDPEAYQNEAIFKYFEKFCHHQVEKLSRDCEQTPAQIESNPTYKESLNYKNFTEFRRTLSYPEQREVQNLVSNNNFEEEFKIFRVRFNAVQYQLRVKSQEEAAQWQKNEVTEKLLFQHLHGLCLVRLYTATDNPDYLRDANEVAHNLICKSQNVNLYKRLWLNELWKEQKTGCLKYAHRRIQRVYNWFCDVKWYIGMLVGIVVAVAGFCHTSTVGTACGLSGILIVVLLGLNEWWHHRTGYTAI